MMRAVAAASALLVVGCAAQSGIVQTGKNTYMATKQAATGFQGAGNLKAEVIAEAGQYCATYKKTIQVLATSESAPPYVFGNYPRAEVNFTCE